MCVWNLPRYWPIFTHRVTVGLAHILDIPRSFQISTGQCPIWRRYIFPPNLIHLLIYSLRQANGSITIRHGQVQMAINVTLTCAGQWRAWRNIIMREGLTIMLMASSVTLLFIRAPTFENGMVWCRLSTAFVNSSELKTPLSPWYYWI